MHSIQMRHLIIKLVLAVMLLNVTTPSLAQFYAPDDKLLVCTADGFRWRTSNEVERQYLELATELGLDLEALGLHEHQEPVTLTQFNGHGNCALCFVDPTPALPEHYNELFLARLTQEHAHTFLPDFPTTSVIKFQRPINKAPPVLIA